MSDQAYWDDVARAWDPANRPPSTWRLFCDGLHVRAFRPWLEGCAGAPALKTDLFDEANGSRALCDLLDAHAPCVVGIDVSREMGARARRRHGLTVYAGDVRRLPHPDGAFGIVLSNSTLDHLASLDEVAVALAEIRRVLRPGGRLLVTMDNFANPVVALRNRLPPPILSSLRIVPYRIGATCGPRRLRVMLSDAGFDVRVMRSLMHVPRWPAVVAAAGIDAIGPPRVLASTFTALGRSFEWMDALPTRYVTGYFTAALAERRI